MRISTAKLLKQNHGHVELDLNLGKGIRLSVYEDVSAREPSNVIKKLKALVARVEKRYQKIKV